MGGELEKTSARLRRRLWLALWLGRVARQGALLGVLCASVALLLRVSYELETARAALAFAPLLVLPFSAARGLRGRVLGPHETAAWMDLRSGGRGYLLLEDELHDPRWAARGAAQLADLPELPALQVGRLARPLLLALAFAVAALYLPVSRAEPGPSGTLFERAIAGLSDQLELLNEVVELDPRTSAELAQRVGALAEEVDGAEPEAMLEAIDALRAELGAEGQGAAELAQSLSQRLDEIGAAAELDGPLALEALGATLERMREGGLAGRVLEGLEALENLPAPLRETLLAGSLKLPAGMELDPATVRELTSLARGVLQEDLGKLSLAGLVNRERLGAMAEGGALAQLLDGLGDGLGDGAADSARGGGASGLTWGDESSRDLASFQAHLLPAGAAADPASSASLGFEVEAPEVAPAGEGAGLVDVQASAGGAAWRRRLRPRHREAVRAFFASPEDG